MTKPSPVRKLLSARAVMARQRKRRVQAGPSIVTVSCCCHVSRSRVRHNVCLGITGGRGWRGEAVTVTETAAADS